MKVIFAGNRHAAILPPTNLNQIKDLKVWVEHAFGAQHDELLNADLKEAITKKAPARSKGELKKAVISHLRRIAKSPGRVKKYFQHASVKYAA